jgi:phenylacetate-CoA ligase
VADVAGQLEDARSTLNGRVVRTRVPASPRSLADRIRIARAEVVVGWPSILMEVADAGEQLRVPWVVTFGEVLHPEWMTSIARAFGATVLDMYALREGGHVAWRCPSADGYHVNADSVLVEIVDDDDRPVPAGVAGDVVVTNLWNLTTPFVRYRTADRAAILAGPCSCGIVFPRMTQVEGRTDDWVLTPDGRRVWPFRLGLMTLLGRAFLDAVARYRVVQQAPDRFLVEVQWTEGRRDDLAALIEPVYRRVLDAEVHVEVRDVAGFPSTAGRKFHLVERRFDASPSGAQPAAAQQPGQFRVSDSR